MTSKQFKIITLGCRTNQYESQAYQRQLEEMGYSRAGTKESADVCIVNTCTVTESADASSRAEIRKLQRENPGAKILVTGCLAERRPDLAKEIPGITHIRSNLEKDRLLEAIFPGEELPEFSIKRFDAHTRAFVKVQDGCNSFCSYCIIPYVRGRSRSRSISEVLREVEGLVASGYKEVVLTGINIGDFDGGEGKGSRLVELIRAVDEIDGLERIRVSSIDPDEVDDELADAIVESKKTCQSMHLVLQSGSNAVLRRMNRKYTRQIFLDTYQRMLAKSPDFTVTTDIIVGFPGESDIDFEETLELMREVQFAKVHMFPYSERPKTRSARFKDKLSPQVVKERKRVLLSLSKELSFTLREGFLGRRMWVLTEGRDPLANGCFGHTGNFLPVHLSETLPANELVLVDLVENRDDGFIGRIVQKQERVS